MKARFRFSRSQFVATISLCLGGAGAALAATDHYWNVGGTGGDGNWGTSPGDKNWNLVAGAAVGNTAWPDTIDDRAVFQDAVGGTVTVFGDVQTNSIRQDGADYTINAGSITLVHASSLAGPAITVQSGTLSIDSTLAGTGGLVKEGGGDLVLSGANTYIGQTLISGGTATLTGSLASTDIYISGGGMLVDGSGGLGGTTTLVNWGTFVVNSDETVATYVHSNGTLSGTGTLTVTGGIVMTGGTVSGTLLGDITSHGGTVISGTVGGGSLNVANGILTLTGTSNNTVVTISTLATLVDSGGGLSSGATITNAGTLTVDSADTISTYVQNGGRLDGTGILTVLGGATLNGGEVSGNLLGNVVTTGNVDLSGTVGGGTLTVANGMLGLTGSSTSSTVDIAASAELYDDHGGLAAFTIVSNAGILTLSQADTIASYTQNGNATLAGPGALTVTGVATLNGGKVTGSLQGAINSTGNVLVSGTIGGSTLAVTGGYFTLSGTSTHTQVNIAAPGTLLDSNGGLDQNATVTNAGILTINAADTISTYVQNGGGRLEGGGVLDLSGINGATLNGGEVAGHLRGRTVSTGNVLVSGSLGGGALEVTGGTLTLTGIANNVTVDIGPAGLLRDVNGGLASNAIVTNAGRFSLGSSDEILGYFSNGGSLMGAGTLTASNATLAAGSSVAGNLAADTIRTQGAVSISGSAVAGSIRIEDGILTNTGLLGTGSTHLDIAAGSTLVASGTQRYGLLTTSGSGAGKWQGNLNNSAVVAPGGNKGFGRLNVTGNFTNSPSGVLKMDVGAAGHDVLGVGGTATFNGTLALKQSGLGQIDAFVPLQLVSAAEYKGNFSSLAENLDGTIFFNPENGTITRVDPGSGSGGLFSGLTRNQKSTWISLYDDVIDPGKTNVTADAGDPSGYQVTSGIADQGNPDLLRALVASFTPAGLDRELLNHLSAEVYAAITDYAMQVTRRHQRTALSAPALNPRSRGDAKGGPGYSAKSSAKDAIQPAPSLGREWEFFAAADYFHAETDKSRNQADYQLSGAGLVAGARNQLTDHFRLAGYFAADDGDIEGNLIDADQSGWSLGIIGETLLHEKTGTRLTTAVSYGQYDADGTRESALATAAGWAPGKVGFSNVDSSALELYAGLETTVYQTGRFRVIPTAGLRYSSGTRDSFTESTGSTVGSPIALQVERESYDEWIAEMGVTAEASVSDQLTLCGQLGFNAGIGDDPHNIRSSFDKGERMMSATADGLTNDLIYIGLGVEYRVNQDVSIGVGYRSDFRRDQPVEQGCNVSSAFRF